MPKTLQFGNAVLCEHVVAGSSNKYTLINVYAGDIIVQKVPVRLSFGIFAEVLAPTVIRDVFLELKLDRKAIVKAEISLPEGRDEDTGLIVIPVVHFPIEKDTVFSAVASAEGFRPKTFLRKRISVGEVSDA